MDNVVEKEIAKVETKISDFFKNTAGQFAIEEVLKPCALVAGVFLFAAFFFTSWIAIEKAPYVVAAGTGLLGYALGQGIVGNVTKQ